MADGDFKQTYEATDSATLVGLLPLLAQRVDAAKQQLYTLSDDADDLDDHWASFAESRGEALMAITRRGDVTKEQRERFRDVLDRLHAEELALAQSMKQTHAERVENWMLHLVGLEARRRTVLEVLAQRNLLPLSPF